MKWPEVCCVSLQEMEENCFDTSIWWAWNCIHCCSRLDDAGSFMGWTPAVYYDESCINGELIDTDRFYNEYFGPRTGMSNHMICNGKLIKHSHWSEPMILMFIDTVKERVWALPLICPLTFDGSGYGHSGEMCIHVPLAEVEVVQQMHPSQAALVAEIKNFANCLDDSKIKEYHLLEAAKLYSQEWPSTKYLNNARHWFQHFFVQSICNLQTPKFTN